MPSSRAKHREKAGELRARAAAIGRALASEYAGAECALRHEDPLQLLVATILSAQCTDERVNQVTPELFRRFRTAADFAASPPGELESLIRPTGFFRNKAKNIRGACAAIAARHAGAVPRTMEALLELPGVARKTANVVLGTAFGIPSGVVVDTHVLRIARLLRLTRAQEPVRIERDLMALLPAGDWIDFSHRMIWHGRRVCIARRPRCSECVLAPLCPSAAPGTRPAAPRTARRQASPTTAR
jgi:endonuclease-3